MLTDEKAHDASMIYGIFSRDSDDWREQGDRGACCRTTSALEGSVLAYAALAEGGPLRGDGP